MSTSPPPTSFDAASSSPKPPATAAPSKKPSTAAATSPSEDRDDTTGPAAVRHNPISDDVRRPTDHSQEAQHAAKALKALSTALGLIANLKRAISCMKDPFKVAHKSQREVHVQNILLLQRRRVPTINVVFARERIILICACISLARDFTEFERRCGWVPKCDQLVARITQGKDTAVQTIGKHLNNYIAHQALSPRPPTLNLSRRNLDAAVRFGIKLIVCESLAQSMRLPSGLSLLMGFECVSFSRLSYATLGYLRQCVEDEVVRAQVVDFGETVGEWWEHCQDRYHERFGAEAAAKRRSSSLSSAGMPLTPHAPMPMTGHEMGKDYPQLAPFPSSMAGLTSAFIAQPGMHPMMDDPYNLADPMMPQYDNDHTHHDLGASYWPQVSDAPSEMSHYSWSSAPPTTTPYNGNISPELTHSPPSYDVSSEHVPVSSYMMPQSTLAPELMLPVTTSHLGEEPNWATAWGDVY